METILITKALALPEDASDRDILDRIGDLRAAAGEDDVEDLDNLELLKLGIHPNVTITPSGAEVSLYVPIKSGSEVLDTLTMRRPTAKYLKDMDEGKKGDLAKLLKMGAELCGKVEAQFDKLDGSDVKLIVDVIVFLRRPPRRTGAKS
jgi:hypothetical protein